MLHRVTFEAVWEGTVPAPADLLDALPTLDAARDGDTQVIIGPPPDGAERDTRISLDPLAVTPSVDSVVSYRPVTASRRLPHIRHLFDFSRTAADGLTDAALRNLPALETLTTDKVRAEFLLALPKLRDLASFFPKTVKDGPCKEVVRTADASLDFLPIIQCWPQDAGRYITFPVVITKDPETGIRNVGTYRMQVFDGKTTAMHWHAHKGGAAHYRKAKARGERIPVAAVLGADPITTFSGTVPRTAAQ